MTTSARRNRRGWDLAHLRSHLQSVVDLELWTIPYYLTALYSIKDPSCEAYRLIQSAVYQEMLHVQLACNLANAFGAVPIFNIPTYAGDNVPHLRFRLDTPNPTHTYRPYSAELGPLDERRINTMCLIEYPEWKTERQPDLRENQSEYGSLGEFYEAVRTGMTELRHELRGDVNQVDRFARFYSNFHDPAIGRDGQAGYRQALELIDAVVVQGEGQTAGVVEVPEQYRNTADGFRDSWTHYRKFCLIRASLELPETFAGASSPAPGTPGYKAQQTLIGDFAAFLQTLAALFGGTQAAGFDAQMAKIGGDTLACWQRDAIPRFS